MSGYSSRAEVVEVLKSTIRNDHNGLGLSRDPADYNMAGLVRDNFYSSGYYGWRAKTGSAAFVESLKARLRVKK